MNYRLRFKSLLRKDDLKRKRLVAINYIYQLFSQATNDIVNNFLAKMNKDYRVRLWTFVYSKIAEYRYG